MPKLASITDVFNAVFMLVRRRTDGTYGVLVITAIPSLCTSWLPFDSVSSGVFRFRWEKDDLKDVILLLRNLGIFVLIYDFTKLQEWSAPLGELPSSETTNNQLHKIAEALPESNTYVEVFGGRSPLLFARPPSPVEVFNDYNRAAVSLFRTLRDPESFGWFYLLSKVLPPSTQFLSSSLWSLWEDYVEKDAAISAYAWYCYVRSALPSIELPTVPEEVPEAPAQRVLSALCSVDPRLVQLHNRLYRVQIEHNTLETIFKIYDSDATLFWVDPPFEGVGALDLDGTYVLLSYLDKLDGSVALYQNGTSVNPHIRQLMRTDGPWRNWSSTEFGRSTVYLKPATA